MYVRTNHISQLHYVEWFVVTCGPFCRELHIPELTASNWNHILEGVGLSSYFYTTPKFFWVSSLYSFRMSSKSSKGPFLFYKSKNDNTDMLARVITKQGRRQWWRKRDPNKYAATTSSLNRRYKLFSLQMQKVRISISTKSLHFCVIFLVHRNSLSPVAGGIPPQLCTEQCSTVPPNCIFTVWWNWARDFVCCSRYSFNYVYYQNIAVWCVIVLRNSSLCPKTAIFFKCSKSSVNICNV